MPKKIRLLKNNIFFPHRLPFAIDKSNSISRCITFPFENNCHDDWWKLSTINNNYISKNQNVDLKKPIFLTGEFEYEGIFHGEQKLEFPSMTYLLFILFLIFMSTIIVNLMIGLAVDDIKACILNYFHFLFFSNLCIFFKIILFF